VTLDGAAKRLTIHVVESDRYRHHSVAGEIVERARRGGLAGCSVFRGSAGLGATMVRYVGNPAGPSGAAH
jgi:uncharacterized protein